MNNQWPSRSLIVVLVLGLVLPAALGDAMVIETAELRALGTAGLTTPDFKPTRRRGR